MDKAKIKASKADRYAGAGIKSSSINIAETRIELVGEHELVPVDAFFHPIRADAKTEIVHRFAGIHARDKAYLYFGRRSGEQAFSFNITSEAQAKCSG